MGILAEIGEDYIVIRGNGQFFFWKCINLKRFIALSIWEGKGRGDLSIYEELDNILRKVNESFGI